MTVLGMTHLCFRVGDMNAVAAALEEHGAEDHRSTRSELPNPGGEPVRLMYVTDPDGVRVELMSGVSGDQSDLRLRTSQSLNWPVASSWIRCPTSGIIVTSSSERGCASSRVDPSR